MYISFPRCALCVGRLCIFSTHASTHSLLWSSELSWANAIYWLCHWSFLFQLSALCRLVAIWTCIPPQLASAQVLNLLPKCRQTVSPTHYQISRLLGHLQNGKELLPLQVSETLILHLSFLLVKLSVHAAIYSIDVLHWLCAECHCANDKVSNPLCQSWV